MSRRITWYERQQKQRTSSWFRLINHSFGLRLFLAATGALLILGIVNRFEHCRARHYLPDCQYQDIASVITVSNVEAFSIMTAALLYVIERGRNREREHLEALEMLNATREAGAVYSIGRIQALEKFCEAGLGLDGVNLQGINLDYIELPDARLCKVNLANTSLVGANLCRADLTGANLSNADFTDANLTQANLTDADLRGANLKRTILTDACLNRTKLDHAIDTKNSMS